MTPREEWEDLKNRIEGVRTTSSSSSPLSVYGQPETRPNALFREALNLAFKCKFGAYSSIQGSVELASEITDYVNSNYWVTQQ